MCRKKKILLAIVAVVLCAALAVMGLLLFSNYQMAKIPGLSFEEALAYTTQDNENAVITVGILKDGKAAYTVYGENGTELPQALHTYEIGSLTKTFTAALAGRAVREGRLSLDDGIDRYLDLPEGGQYPTIEQLLTHTSGYKPYYFEMPMVGNFFSGRNDFCGITKEMVLLRTGHVNLGQGVHAFEYSNFGFAVLGLVLEKVYQEDYTALMNAYLREELGLQNTKISEGDGDLGHYWDWKKQDAYLPAGALTSDIADMLAYAEMQLDGMEPFALCQESREAVNASSESYRTMGIHMDEIGMAWILDRENGFIWHNGGTGSYNSYLGFCPDTGTAVVVLSNLPPSERIPATVLGIKRLQALQ